MINDIKWVQAQRSHRLASGRNRHPPAGSSWCQCSHATLMGSSKHLNWGLIISIAPGIALLTPDQSKAQTIPGCITTPHRSLLQRGARPLSGCFCAAAPRMPTRLLSLCSFSASASLLIRQATLNAVEMRRCTVCAGIVNGGALRSWHPSLASANPFRTSRSWS